MFSSLSICYFLAGFISSFTCKDTLQQSQNLSGCNKNTFFSCSLDSAGLQDVGLIQDCSVGLLGVQVEEAETTCGFIFSVAMAEIQEANPKAQIHVKSLLV